MSLSRIEEEIVAYVHGFAPSQQDEVLAFVRSLLATPVGIPSHELLAFVGIFTSEDLKVLQKASALDCEQVDDLELI
ncbi:MAG: hypothetical protein U0822_05090 [Anaerolineae bacterium]